MKSERKRMSLLEDTYAYIGRSSDEENAEAFKNEVKNYISTIKEIVEADFDGLTDKELSELLTKVYNIYLDDKDYLEILSKRYNKEYTHFYRIPTTLTFYDTKQEGQGINFSWWPQLYQIYYNVVATNDVNFDCNKIYTKDEIKEMVDTKDIVILKQESEEIMDNQEFEKEEYEELSILDIDINDYGNNISQFIINNYQLFGEILRKKFTKKNVLNDMKKLINDLEDDINAIFYYANSNDTLNYNISRICKEWFDTSNDKKEYEFLQKKLSYVDNKK